MEAPENKTDSDRVSAEKMPDELADALRVMVGERPDSFKNEFRPNTSSYPKFDGAGFAGESAQEEFLKNKDPVEKKVKFLENSIFVLDLTNEAQKSKYAEVLDLIGDPESGIVLAEELKDPQILLDSNSPMGYRAIAIIKTARPKMYVKPLTSGYSVQKKSKSDKENVEE